LLLEQSRLSCIAIDEAHCISEWGHDFRPEYRRLAPLRNRFPAAVWIALTATATIRVREDIRRLLQIPREGEFVASFNRPNLLLAAERRRDGLAQILAFLQPRRGQSGIIYCGKRKQADDLCADLNANGWPAVTYHAGMEGSERNQNQEKFIHDEVPLVVATIAFGMGINKSNVRFVIHDHMPKDLESYYQEIGRAGRDGLPASCFLLYSHGDAVLHRRFIDEGAASQRIGRQARLAAMLQFAETRGCRRKPLLAYFGETLASGCGHCDNCIRGAPRTPMVDRTPEAVLLLSCARLTDQIFRQEHLVQILRGSRAEKILRKGHGHLPVYGSGKEHSAEWWQMLAGHLLDAGFLERDQQFGSLRLSSRAFDVLEGREKALLPEQAQSPAAAPESVGPPDTELLQKLKALRKRLAGDARLPAFCIFSDRSLLDMTQRLPGNREQFLAVHGVGEMKWANYGQPFLELIREHCAAPVGPNSSGAEIKRLPGARAVQIGKLFADGQTLQQIAASFQIQPETVVNHLYGFHQSGGAVNPARVLRESAVEPSQQERVFETFKHLGAERLGPVFHGLGGAVPYKELHLLRLYWFCKQRG
jgi:ATP-dependent DNA helicase RecQ